MPTNIEFVDETWNPWQGCRKVSAGCDNCYMYREKKRFGDNPENVVKSSFETFMKPTKLKPGTWIFTCSWSDFFIEDADPWRAHAWDIIRQESDKCFVIITKRPELIKERLPKDWGNGYDNVIMGFTAEDNGNFHKRWDIIGKIPSKRYLCIHEPALGAIKFSFDFLRHGPNAWVIAGGETSPDARPAHIDWFVSDMNQCEKAGIPFFFKSWGEWAFSYYRNTFNAERYDWPKGFSYKVGKKNSGNRLIDREIKRFPSVNLSNIQQSFL